MGISARKASFAGGSFCTTDGGVGALFRGLVRRGVRFRSFAVVRAGRAVANDPQETSALHPKAQTEASDISGYSSPVPVEVVSAKAVPG